MGNLRASRRKPARGDHKLAVASMVDRWAGRMLAQLACSLLRDQSGYVASILSRRPKRFGPMWDLDNIPLLCRVSHSCPLEQRRTPPRALEFHESDSLPASIQ